MQWYLACYYSAASSHRQPDHIYRCALGTGFLCGELQETGECLQRLKGLCAALPCRRAVSVCAVQKHGLWAFFFSLFLGQEAQVHILLLKAMVGRKDSLTPLQC